MTATSSQDFEEFSDVLIELSSAIVDRANDTCETLPHDENEDDINDGGELSINEGADMPVMVEVTPASM